MLPSKQKILAALPAPADSLILIKDRQGVDDIINLILSRHDEYAADYDKIAMQFAGKNLEETANNLAKFCRQNIKYKEEPEKTQTVLGPAGILDRGQGDCKHYALFIGGCLDAIARISGDSINWYYCFASYDPLKTDPYHVFVIADDGQGELYIDPTPGADGMEPVYMSKQRPAASAVSGFVVTGLGELLKISGPSASYGDLLPAPAWYPANLPRFYRAPGGAIVLRPLASVSNYTEGDVLDCMLYWQTIVGYNRVDNNNAFCVAWVDSHNGQRGDTWVRSAFKADQFGDGSGNFAAIPSRTIDGSLYAKLQLRYIEREKPTRPWLADMQGKGGGIDLMTLPFATDVEQPRPANYPAYLPSLFKSAGQPFQKPAGFMTTKPLLRDGKSSGFTEYIITPDDIAHLMLYAQPIILAGPTPYPCNWYINDDVNGAMAMYFKITLGFTSQHTNAQMQWYGIDGDLMQQPNLDANPYTSAFSSTLKTIVSAAVSFFAGKIPGGTTLIKAGTVAANISGGQLITGTEGMPPGQFSAAVFQAADGLYKQQEAASRNKNILLIVLIALGVLGYIYRDDLKKLFK